jgi:hypothetical protein
MISFSVSFCNNEGNPTETITHDVSTPEKRENLRLQPYVLYRRRFFKHEFKFTVKGGPIPSIRMEDKALSQGRAANERMFTIDVSNTILPDYLGNKTQPTRLTRGKRKRSPRERSPTPSLCQVSSRGAAGLCFVGFTVTFGTLVTLTDARCRNSQRMARLGQCLQPPRALLGESLL